LPAILAMPKLVDRVRRVADPDDARELAERVAQAIQRPDQRVGAALMPKGRGGNPSWLADNRRNVTTRIGMPRSRPSEPNI
jgi:hypothetical protein